MPSGTRVADALLIDGEWVSPQSGRSFESIDPGTGLAVASIAEGDAADINLAVAAARTSFEDRRWRDLPSTERALVLWRVADLIDQHSEELTALECRIVAAARGNLKRLTLELGGKSPFVILEDADLDAAIPAAAAIFANAGQVCSAGSRLLVSGKIAGRVVEDIAKIAAEPKVGYCTEPGVDIGPLISARQLERVTGYIAGAVALGAEVVAGGGRIGDAGYFIEPAVLLNVGADTPVAREEIFGPVVAVVPFADMDEALAMANDTDYGLSSSVWTTDVGKAHAFARRLRAGRVGINVHSPGDYRMPSGGFKQSGWGREHGPNGLDPYLEEKSVFTRLAF